MNGNHRAVREARRSPCRKKDNNNTKKRRGKNKKKEKRRQRRWSLLSTDISLPAVFLARATGLTKPRYNRRPTELMKAELKGQSLLINLRRARKKQMTGVRATKR